MREITMDVSGVASFEDFVAAANESFIVQAGGKWNGNLDAFNDYLSWPEPSPYRLKLRGSEACRTALGYEAQATWLHGILQTCHPANKERVQAEIDDAGNGRGPTLFDVLVEIMTSEANREFVEVVLE